jgi:two-component system response regulator
MTENPPPFLFVEDTISDYEAARRGLRRLGIQAPTVCFPGLDTAADYLIDPRHQRPGLIVLDLRLPDGDGTELLRLIRGHDRLRPVPVAIWSATDAPAVIESCYDQGADTYVAKTANRIVFGDSIRQLARLWKPDF